MLLEELGFYQMKFLEVINAIAIELCCAGTAVHLASSQMLIENTVKCSLTPKTSSEQSYIVGSLNSVTAELLIFKALVQSHAFAYRRPRVRMKSSLVQPVRFSAFNLYGTAALVPGNSPSLI